MSKTRRSVGDRRYLGQLHVMVIDCLLHDLFEDTKNKGLGFNQGDLL